MTDQSDTNAMAASDEADVVVGIISDGAHSLLVARFKTMDEAVQARNTLTELERTTSLQIDGVMLASADNEGKIHLGELTEHSTKTGLKWGLVGGALLGLVFPPTIIAGAIGGGAIGAVIGKVRNTMNRGGVADELAKVMQPNTAGLLALVQDTSVVEVRRALARADEIVTKAIDKQMAAEIDREAAAAKSELAANG